MKVDNADMETWQRLRAARTAAKKTQQQIADACGLTREAVSLWESPDPAKRNQISLGRLRVYAKVCGVSLESLLDERDENVKVESASHSVSLDPAILSRAVQFMQRQAAMHGAAFDPLRDADLLAQAYGIEAAEQQGRAEQGNVLEFGQALYRRLTERAKDSAARKTDSRNSR